MDIVSTFDGGLMLGDITPYSGIALRPGLPALLWLYFDGLDTTPAPAPVSTMRIFSCVYIGVAKFNLGI